ncbi:phosphatase PAP2 family protein [Caenimonas sp. SL110]|uniref:phosphatase PAP2 family protein n=1 Tax=Caenimonas sp. SL110 TaxID=1450524 RepID=UPI00065337D8|nr:phosphatase PAP2 family protein [Caenimonas sp. SL110]
MQKEKLGAVLKWTFGALALVVMWDVWGLDLATAELVGSSHGFPLREHWLFSSVLHNGARRLSWAVALALCVGVWWPVGILRQLSTSRRAQLAVTTLVAASAVSLVKSFSMTSCPWDLEAFGGVARYVSHWMAAPDGGSGHCFPAGHASAGFALIGGYFAFADRSPRIARYWLIGALLAGLVLGLAQQVRGAHFMSHTLWTALICWCVALGIDQAFGLWRRRTEWQSLPRSAL